MSFARSLSMSDDCETESEPPPYTPPIEIRHNYSDTLLTRLTHESQQSQNTLRLQRETTPISLTLIYQLLQLTSLLPALTGVLYLLIRTASPQRTLPNPSRIEYLASTPWAILTAVHSFQIISSMLHRLLSIQAASFPWIRVTLWVTSEPEKPLIAWIIVAYTTAISSTLARWYISNLSKSSKANQSRHLDINRLVTRTILPITTLSVLSLLFVLYDLYTTRLALTSNFGSNNNAIHISNLASLKIPS
ncbi:hypothetical protein E3Q22_00021 [Wallemia mellicola]|uniref:Uncharacterized protein n=1 Tax=Wallemia mellicola TaxID=1708541 RepID=A0A4T0SSP5_9BASI|nr:hypothetical protein E3Q24_00307 [Wallemia mellicola]TIB79630.1 hypothetical protein E3Q23_00017 [Wallemia mellicola]TIB82737.1 hypothetical protein E3Q22_00021 [Wallemia mellicola]TIB83921.1 hypothetical protein E3Q21_02622 [Wallemia mellicola]TIB87033.1 hypothetical protein E3Q20_02640 [Wallemia mellicola]